MRYALVDADGTVRNVVVIDAYGWVQPKGLALVQVEDGERVEPGWTHDGTAFVAPPTPSAAGGPDLAPELVQLLVLVLDTSLPLDARAEALGKALPSVTPVAKGGPAEATPITEP